MTKEQRAINGTYTKCGVSEDSSSKEQLTCQDQFSRNPKSLSLRKTQALRPGRHPFTSDRVLATGSSSAFPLSPRAVLPPKGKNLAHHTHPLPAVAGPKQGNR